MGWMWGAGAPVLLGALYMFLTYPDPRRRARALPRRYAHRGLHGDGVSENGLAAFERACEAGLGIEFDVRFSADGAVVVFHDDTLARVCGVEARVDGMTLEELRAVPLPDGGVIPTLDDVLALVGGRVPLLVEIKNGPGIGRLCAATWEKLRAYRGEVAVESFNPLAMRWFKHHAGGVLRGQLVAGYDDYLEITGAAVAFALSNLLLNCLSRPDFVAYEIGMARTFALRVQRKIYRAPLAAWTVRTRGALRWLQRSGQSAIFEVELGNNPILLGEDG